MNLELTHYGVKGMKWGIVRKDRKAGRKAAKNHIKMVSNFLNKILQFEKQAQEELEKIVRYYEKDFQERKRELDRINSGG